MSDSEDPEEKYNDIIEDSSNDPATRAYHKVPLNENKAYEDYNANERRAYLLREIKEVGLPSSINKSSMGDKFGVSHVQIHHDIEILKEWMADHLDIDHESEAYSVFSKARNELLKKGEYTDAVKVQEAMSEWLEDRGAVENESEDEGVTFEAKDLDITFETVESPDSSDEEAED